MNEQALTPGSYLQQLIDEESRAVVKRQDFAGYIAMWLEAVRKVMEKFPNLSAQERAGLRGTVEEQVQLLSSRSGIDIHQFYWRVAIRRSNIGRRDALRPCRYAFPLIVCQRGDTSQLCSFSSRS
jgi:hypothetical protein